jgi:hypothetical protein
VHAITGFRGSRRDEDIQAGGPVSSQPTVTDEEERDCNPCSEDEEFFQGGPDEDAMEEAITKFLDGMEGQERSGFKDLHSFLGRLPCPTVEKVGRSMSHKQALQGGFLPKMDAEEQKRFTPSELLLYRHALEYRYLYYACTMFIHCTYIVHTIACSLIHCTYTVHIVHIMFIHCTYMVHTKACCTYIVHTMYIHI